MVAHHTTLAPMEKVTSLCIVAEGLASKGLISAEQRSGRDAKKRKQLLSHIYSPSLRSANGPIPSLARPHWRNAVGGAVNRFTESNIFVMAITTEGVPSTSHVIRFPPLSSRGSVVVRPHDQRPPPAKRSHSCHHGVGFCGGGCSSPSKLNTPEAAVLIDASTTGCVACPVRP